jgi:hypothetical protein
MGEKLQGALFELVLLIVAALLVIGFVFVVETAMQGSRP